MTRLCFRFITMHFYSLTFCFGMFALCSLCRSNAKSSISAIFVVCSLLTALNSFSLLQCTTTTTRHTAEGNLSCVQQFKCQCIHTHTLTLLMYTLLHFNAKQANTLTLKHVRKRSQFMTPGSVSSWRRSISTISIKPIKSVGMQLTFIAQPLLFILILQRVKTTN